MVQRIRRPSFGAEFGTGLGTGLGRGLSQLAQEKMEQMRGERLGETLQLLGLPKGLGQIASFNPQFATQLAKQQGDFQQKQLQQQRENLISGQVGEAISPEQQQLEELQRGTQEEKVEPFVPQSPGAKGATEIENLERALAGKNIPARDKSEILKRVETRQDRFNKQQATIDKKNEKWLDGVRETEEGSREADQRLDLMEELIETEKLPSRPTAIFADLLERGIPVPFTNKNLGINLKGLLFSTEGQRFDKIVKDFAKNARKFFPRVTEGQVKLFLESIPTLLQSDEGKKDLIKTIRFFNQSSQLNFETAKNLIDQNKGFQPPNLQARVEKIVKPQIDELQKQLQQQIKNSVKTAKKIKRSPTSLSGILGGQQPSREL